jgi:hypothetical protein
MSILLSHSRLQPFWAHHAFAVRFALTAVDADRHGLGKIAAGLWHVRIGIAHAGIPIGRPIQGCLHRGIRIV